MVKIGNSCSMSDSGKRKRNCISLDPCDYSLSSSPASSPTEYASSVEIYRLESFHIDSDNSDSWEPSGKRRKEDGKTNEERLITTESYHDTVKDSLVDVEKIEDRVAEEVDIDGIRIDPIARLSFESSKKGSLYKNVLNKRFVKRFES